MDKLRELNSADENRALAIVSPLIERAPEIAEKVVRKRPFQNTDELSLAIREALLQLSEIDRVSLFRAHPELAPQDPFDMTKESQREQGRLELTSRISGHRSRFTELNESYRRKFGFPFITALVRHPDLESVLCEFEARLRGDRHSEIETAIEQVAIVSAARVQEAFADFMTSSDSRTKNQV